MTDEQVRVFMKNVLSGQITDSRVLETMAELIEEKWNVVFMGLSQNQESELRNLQDKIRREHSTLRQLGQLRGKIKMASRVNQQPSAKSGEDVEMLSPEAEQSV